MIIVSRLSWKMSQIFHYTPYIAIGNNQSPNEEDIIYQTNDRNGRQRKDRDTDSKWDIEALVPQYCHH